MQMVLLHPLSVVPLTEEKKDIKTEATIMVVQAVLVAAVNSEMVVQTALPVAAGVTVMAALVKVQPLVNLEKIPETCMPVAVAVLFTKTRHILAALAVAAMVMLPVQIT